jgi:hypothetical protein
MVILTGNLSLVIRGLESAIAPHLSAGAGYQKRILVNFCGFETCVIAWEACINHPLIPPAAFLAGQALHEGIFIFFLLSVNSPHIHNS